MQNGREKPAQVPWLLVLILSLGKNEGGEGKEKEEEGKGERPGAELAS